MTIVELTIVMVISAIVLFVATQGVGIVQRLVITQTHKIIESNTLFNDYLLFETAVSSLDSIVYSANSSTIFCNNRRLCISNRDSVAVFGRDTLFKTSHRITYSSKSDADTLFVTISSPDTESGLSFLLSQRIQNTRDEKIEKTEANYNYFEE